MKFDSDTPLDDEYEFENFIAVNPNNGRIYNSFLFN